ncbi:hypothetical protein ABZW67_06180 [Streptomyces rubiginosohelvolus]|uniref:hypothetical protein n=1 Tax=Streptomyces rubiginosohelvolus TaxID=67362 RepID=UPI0033A9647D
MKEIRTGWNFWDCGCSFVVNLKERRLCGFDGPNVTRCAVMQELQRRFVARVGTVGGDWEARRLVIHEMGEHIGFSKEQMQHAWPAVKTAGA